VTVKEYAELYKVAERTVKRWRSQGLPVDDEPRMRQIIAVKRSRLGCTKLSPRGVIPPAPAPAAPLSDPERDLIAVHLALAAIRCDLLTTRPDIADRLTAVLDITQPYIEE
jgi:hypothetical protein